MSWNVKLKAITHNVSGKKRTINRKIKGHDVKKEVVEAINSLDNPWEFYGVGLEVITPLHFTEYVIDPDTKQLICIS